MLREYALLRVFLIGIYAMCGVHALSDQQRKVLRDPGLCAHSRAGPHLQVFNLHSLLAHPGRSSSANSTAVRPFGAPPQTRQFCFFEQIAEAGAHQVMVIGQQYLQHIAPYVLARKRILVFHSDRN